MPTYTPTPADDLEALDLNGFALNDDTDLDLEALEFTPAQPQTEWLSGPDSEGSIPAADEQWSNAELQLRLRVRRQSSTDAALGKIRELLGVLAECYRTPGGLPLEWTPNNGTATTTFYALRAFVNGIPITHDGDDTGWLQRTPVVNVRLVLAPFGEGREVLLPAVTSTDPLIAYELEGADVYRTRWNLITNPSFEVDAAEWDATGAGAISRVTTPAPPFTTGALRVEPASAGDGASTVAGEGVRPYRTYIASAYVWAAAGDTVEIALGEYTDAAALVGSTTATIVGDDDWQRVSVSRTFSRTGLQARLTISNDTDDSDFYIAAALLERGSTLLSYFDGTGYYSAGDYVTGDDACAWTGTEHASVSAFGLEMGHASVAATGRLIVGDDATQNRDHVEWGLEMLDAASGPDLYTDAAGMSAQASSSSTRSGSVGANVRRVTLTPSYQSCFGWDGIENVGRFRVRARVYHTETGYSLPYEGFTARLAYRSGDASMSYSQPIANVTAGGWQELDFGVVDLRAVKAGTQSSDLRVEVKGRGVLDGDVLYLIPVSCGYGKARADLRSLEQAVTTYNARDEFEQAAGNLNGVTAPLGGSWATAGSTTDLAIHADDYLYRATTSDSGPRRGIIGSSIADQIVWATIGRLGGAGEQGVVGRYVDASNYFFAYYQGGEITVYKRVAGTDTFLARFGVPTTTAFIAAAIYSDGNWTVSNGAISRSGQDADLATGGALASGKGGVYDQNTSAGAAIRTYDNFAFFGADAVHALNADRTIEFRSDSTVRYNAAGTLLGEPPMYRGSRFYVPPAGQSEKVARVAVKARRGDSDATADLGPTDSTTVQVAIRPRFLTPR